MENAQQFTEIMESWRVSIGREALERAQPGQTLRAKTTHVHFVRSAPEEATIVQNSTPDAPVQITLIPKNESLARQDEYTLHEMVGEGGMGQIFRADQGSLCRDVAIKKIIPEHLDNENAQERQDAFVSEALVTGVLEHPNIVPVHALGQDENGHWFFSMKMVRGVAWKYLLHPDSCINDDTYVASYAKNLHIDEPKFRAEHLEENLKILQAVCNAVAFAHSKNIIHRDLKPENVMVGAFGEVLVMDWGLAVDVSEAPNQAEARVPHRSFAGLGGTAEYMAPEQCFAAGNRLCAQTDVFLLGAILHELLTGRAPNAAQNFNASLLKACQCDAPREFDKVLPELAEICRKALSKNPQKRYSDALEFQKALNEFVKHRQSAQTASKAAREAQHNDIRALSRAVILYDQALELWPGNKSAANAVQRTRAALAEKEVSANRTRFAARSLAAVVILGLTVGFVWIGAVQKEAVAHRIEAEKQKGIAESALKKQRQLSFEAVYRNAQADDAKGESERVIESLQPFVSNAEFAEHELLARANALFDKAQDNIKRFASFQEHVKAREKNVSLDLGHGMMLELILIPKGSFEMGSTKYDVDSKRSIEITKPFYMGKFPVTQEQYEGIIGTNPSVFADQKKNPVETVNWFEAVAFCDKLNRQSGPAKITLGLPTEAQWEYACRAGTKTEYYFGNDEKELDKYAWFATNAGLTSGDYGAHTVGSKPANPFGLFDMHGNVGQWCQNWYDLDYYKNSQREDPTGPTTGLIDGAIRSPGARVIRGGNFNDPAWMCRACSRSRMAPVVRNSWLGFRVVLPLDPIPSDRHLPESTTNEKTVIPTQTMPVVVASVKEFDWLNSFQWGSSPYDVCKFLQLNAREDFQPYAVASEFKSNEVRYFHNFLYQLRTLPQFDGGTIKPSKASCVYFFFEKGKLLGVSLRFTNDAQCPDHSFVIEQFANDNKITTEKNTAGKPSFRFVNPRATIVSRYLGNREVRIEVFAPDAPRFEGQDW